MEKAEIIFDRDSYLDDLGVSRRRAAGYGGGVRIVFSGAARSVERAHDSVLLPSSTLVKVDLPVRCRACTCIPRGCSKRRILFQVYQEQVELPEPLPAPNDKAIQAVLERESDAKIKGSAVAEYVDASFFRDIEKSGLIEKLYGK